MSLRVNEAISPFSKGLPRSKRPRNDTQIEQALSLSPDLGICKFSSHIEPEINNISIFDFVCLTLKSQEPFFLSSMNAPCGHEILKGDNLCLYKPSFNVSVYLSSSP